MLYYKYYTVVCNALNYFFDRTTLRVLENGWWEPSWGASLSHLENWPFERKYFTSSYVSKMNLSRRFPWCLHTLASLFYVEASKVVVAHHFAPYCHFWMFQCMLCPTRLAISWWRRLCTNLRNRIVCGTCIFWREFRVSLLWSVIFLYNNFAV